MTTVIVSTALAALFAWLASSDIRNREVGLIFVTFRRKSRPVPFWVLVTLEILLAALFALLAVGAFFAPPDTCFANGVCTVTVRIPSQ